jgi:2-keto-4-pentenoate hydratase
MDIDSERVEQCRGRLWAAECARVPATLLTQAFPDLDRPTAYAIQRATFRHRGAALAGFKLGGTVRPPPGEDRRAYGRLSVAHRIEGADVAADVRRFLQPCVEPEIALRLARDLGGPGHTRESVAAHLDAAIPALEIADTRYPDFPAALVDNIADNCSSGAFVLGEPVAWARLGDVRGVAVRFHAGDALLDEGVGADAMGDPLLTLAWLAAELAACDEAIPAGAIVMTGGLVASVAATSGRHIRARFDELGTVGVHIA